MEQSAIEKVLANSFAENGWDGLTGATESLTHEQQHAASLKKYENALEIARAFMDSDGALALQRLRERTIYQPTWAPEATGAMDGAAAGFAREGQNSIIRFIEECIVTAEKGPPAPLPTGGST